MTSNYAELSIRPKNGIHNHGVHRIYVGVNLSVSHKAGSRSIEIQIGCEYLKTYANK